MKSIKESGFTLPEIMITLGIVAIVLSLAVPSVSNTIKDNRLVTQTNSVVADIHFARSEAAKRDVLVILCRTNLPNKPSPTCYSGGDLEKNWSKGYLIFADDGNNTNSVYNAGSDILLRRGQPASDGVRLRTNWTMNKNLMFIPNGALNEGVGAVAMMSVCDDRSEERGRKIIVTPSGVPRLESTGIDTCTP